MSQPRGWLENRPRWLASSAEALPAEPGTDLGIGARFPPADARHGVGQRRERQLPGGRETLAQAAR